MGKQVVSALGETRPQMVPRIMQIWESPEQVAEAIQEYAERQRAESRPLTWAGIARVTGVEPSTLRGYKAGSIGGLPPAWLVPLKDAALLVEEQHEERLHQAACVGSIFALKQRGWADTQHVEHSGTVASVLLQVDLGVTRREHDAIECDTGCILDGEIEDE